MYRGRLEVLCVGLFVSELGVFVLGVFVGCACAACGGLCENENRSGGYL